MATMDMIKLAGGEPANFLDIGGGATPERVAKAFRLVMSDTMSRPSWSTFLPASTVATGSPKASFRRLEDTPVDVPLVVRLAGTNVEEGRKILTRSGLPIIRAATLAEAAQRAVAAWQNNQKHNVKMVIAS